MFWRLSLLLVLCGCPYRAKLTSTPTGAIVKLPDGRSVTTPSEIKFRWAPGRPIVVTATARGYRPLTVDLKEDEIRFRRYLWRGFRDYRSEIELVLIPSHGPAGSWAEPKTP